jgi:hypothetical protein
MTFFTKNECINHFKQTNKTKTILLKLYDDISEAHEYVSSLKHAKGPQFYNISIKHIQTASQIIKPKNFNGNSFPLEIRNHINETSFSELSYSFSLLDKEIKLYFITEDNVEDKIDTYNKYVDTILMWIYILNQYSSKLCAKTFTVYFYFTSLEKKVPKASVSVIDEINVNTAFTTTCPRDSEIVIYRKEEWFKVFMHETFHNFGLDFSDMNNDICTQDILNIFPVDSKVNLYESYAEFWAEIMNALFCSFLKLKNKKNAEEFLLNAEFFINFERTHSFFQLVKILRFMGLQYKDLYLNTKRSKVLRETMYKEETNVLSYYVIKTILMNNYQGFLSWCNTNNLSLLQFKKTPANLKEFCAFIEKNYKTQSMIKGVDTTAGLFNQLNNSKKASNEYIVTNLRMSICELG